MTIELTNFRLEDKRSNNWAMKASVPAYYLANKKLISNQSAKRVASLMKKKGLVKENKREKAITFSKNTETNIPT